MLLSCSACAMKVSTFSLPYVCLCQQHDGAAAVRSQRMLPRICMIPLPWEYFQTFGKEVTPSETRALHISYVLEFPSKTAARPIFCVVVNLSCFVALMQRVAAGCGCSSPAPSRLGVFVALLLLSSGVILFSANECMHTRRRVSWCFIICFRSQLVCQEAFVKRRQAVGGWSLFLRLAT